MSSSITPLPFSAPNPRSLPTSVNQPLEIVLANWQAQLANLISVTPPQVTPTNFAVSNQRGGMSLSWSPVPSGDGYEILKSANGSFVDDLQIVPVKNPAQCSYFDGTGGAATKVSYRIRTTSGTAANPQSQRGPESGPIQHTSIAVTDTTASPTVKYDTSTTTQTQSLARKGNYGAFRLTGLGKSGGANAGTGGATTAGGGTGGGVVPPPTPTTECPWSGLFGDMTISQVAPWDGPNVGTPDTGISRDGVGSLAIGNGSTGDASGNLDLATVFASSSVTLGVNATSAGTLVIANGGALGVSITLQNLGCTSAYNFNLPTTAGAAGSVLTSQGGSSTSMTWTTQAALAVSWSSLVNPTGNLTLSMAGYTTTFNQTSGIAWLWANTTAATSSIPQSSPALTLEGTWWGGGLASATDGWLIQDQPGASVTLASGVITHVVETSGSGVTLTLTSGGTTWPTGTWVVFAGFTTATWLNGVPIQIGTTSSTSIGFNDPTNHGALSSTLDTASGSGAISYLTLSQISSSAPIGAFRLLNSTAGTVSSVNASPQLQFSENYWTGSASATTTWTIGSFVLAGTNAQTNLAITAVSGGTTPATLILNGETPNFIFQNSGSTTAPTGQFRFTGNNATPGAGTIYWGFGSHQYAASGTFEIFGGSGTVSNAVQVFTATGQCGIGIGNLTPSATLEVYNAKASTGATQLLIQGGAVAADATTNTLFQINQGGGTTALFSITGAGHVNNGAADFQGSVSSAPTGIMATTVVVAVGGATGTFTVTSTEGFTVGDTVTLSATGWTAGSGLASTTSTVASVTSTTVLVLTYVSGGPWVAGTYTAQTGTLTQTGGTSVSVIYKTAYTNTPTVMVTPTANCGAWYISASSTSGFTITYATSGTKTFNYLVLGNPN